MMVPAQAKQLLRPARDRSVALWQRHVFPGFARRVETYDAATMPESSLVLVTYNRLRMLRECLSSLLETTQGADCEIIVWDNDSNDGSKEYLDELAASHLGLRVIHSAKNVGLNGVALSVELARGRYLVELDDDVVRFPVGWLTQMLRAFQQVPGAGFLAANVVQDERTNGHKEPAQNYTPVDYGGIVIEQGMAGGWCAVTSLEVLARVGNFPKIRGKVFFSEDGDYGRRCRNAGLVVGIVRDVVVYHACGAAANDDYGYLDLCFQKYGDAPRYAEARARVRKYADGRAADRSDTGKAAAARDVGRDAAGKD
jgi:GT2 family glycosyltransferase